MYVVNNWEKKIKLGTDCKPVLVTDLYFTFMQKCLCNKTKPIVTSAEMPIHICKRSKRERALVIG